MMFVELFGFVIDTDLVAQGVAARKVESFGAQKTVSRSLRCLLSIKGRIFLIAIAAPAHAEHATSSASALNVLGRLPSVRDIEFWIVPFVFGVLVPTFAKEDWVSSEGEWNREKAGGPGGAGQIRSAWATRWLREPTVTTSPLRASAIG